MKKSLLEKAIPASRYLSYLYLVIAITFAWLLYDYYAAMPNGFNANSSLSQIGTIIFLGLASICYLIHFFYGALYYPKRNIMAIAGKISYDDVSNNDASDFRGVIGTILFLIAYIVWANTLIEGLIAKIFVALIWIGLNIFLNRFTVLCRYLTSDSMVINLTTIDPAIKDKEDKDLIYTISYTYPKGEDQLRWAIIKAKEAIEEFREKDGKGEKIKENTRLVIEAMEKY